MKIGFTLDTLENITGKERVVYELGKKLSNKHEVYLITFKNRVNKQIKQLFEEAGFNIVFLKNFHHPIKNRIMYLTRYKKEISELKLDIINTHGLILANAASLSMIPTVKTYHAHVTLWSEFFHNPVRWIDYVVEEKISIYFAKKVIAISLYTQTQLKKFYGKKSIVIHNGVDTKTFRPHKKLGEKFREKYSLEDSIVIGCIGRFTPQKNQKILLDVSKEVDSNIKILLVGSGPLENYYKYLVKKEKLNEKFVFLKKLKEEELIEFYNSLDIYFHTSLWEGFGLPILEAQACEKPVIAFNKTAMKEIILHKKTGYLCNNKNEIVKAIESLMDEKNRKKIGKNARKFSKKFDWKIIAKKYEKIFKEVVEN